MSDGNAPGAAAGDGNDGEKNDTVYDYDLSTEQTREPAELLTVGQEFERKIRSRQEVVRTVLAVGAFASLVMVLLVLVAAAFGEITVDNVEKMSSVIVTPLTGIVGTIIGFYFAERRSGGT